MAFAADPCLPFDYVLARERILPDQTVWHLKPLTLREKAYLDDTRGALDHATSQYQIHRGARRLTLLRCGLTGWENLRERQKDGSEHQIVFVSEDATIAGVDRKVPTDATLTRILDEDQEELANVIERGASLSESDRKNS